MVNKPLEVQLHLQRAVPVLKGKHGAPVQPESGVKHFFVEHILDGLVIEILILRHKEFHNLHTALLAQIEPAVRVGVLPSVYGGTTERVVRILLVQPVVFVQHRHTRRLDGRNAAEQIPQALKMVLHLSAAAHHITSGGIVDAVASAARYIHGFQNMNVAAGHLSVAYKEARRRQGGETAAYDVSVFLVHAFRFPRLCERLIIAVAVIDALAVFIIPAKLGVAVIQLCVLPMAPARSLPCFFPVKAILRHLPLLQTYIRMFLQALRRQRRACSCCRNCRHAKSDIFLTCHICSTFLIPAVSFRRCFLFDY